MYIPIFFFQMQNSYNKVIEIIGRIFHGEAMSYVSVLLEQGVAKYDKIVKDLHLSFIKYVQNMYTKISDSISNYWKKSLQRLEPSIMKFFHHIESVVWSVSSEIFGNFNTFWYFKKGFISLSFFLRFSLQKNK